MRAQYSFEKLFKAHSRSTKMHVAHLSKFIKIITLIQEIDIESQGPLNVHKITQMLFFVANREIAVRHVEEFPDTLDM